MAVHWRGEMASALSITREVASRAIDKPPAQSVIVACRYPARNVVETASQLDGHLHTPIAAWARSITYLYATLSL